MSTKPSTPYTMQDLGERIEHCHPELSVQFTDYGEYYRIETFKDGQMWFRHYSFEPDFNCQMDNLYPLK